MRDFFANPGFGYNAANFVLAVLGTVLGVAGLGFAYWQIAKTMASAEAARRASEATARELGRIAVVIDVKKLSVLCREVRASASVDALSAVSRPLHDLRVGLAELQSTSGRALCPPETWIQMIASVAAVQGRVETSGRKVYSQKLAADVRSVVSQVDEELHTMVPRATATPVGGS